MVVAERGSAWDRWAECFGCDEATSPTLLLQEGAESAADFAQRVRSHVASLAADHVPQRVVLVGGRAGDTMLSARSLIIRAIANGMLRRGGGELLLDDHDSDRFTMRALADTVADMLRGSGVAVDVTHATPESVARPRDLLRVA